MTFQEISKVGKRGTIVIPADFRRRMGIEEGSYVILEEADGGLLVHGAVVMPVEIYSPERKAEFLLSNAVNEQDYAAAVEEVRAMGLNPDKIEHSRPSGA